MKSHFIILLGAIIAISAQIQAQEITASLSDDLAISNVSAINDVRNSMPFNKKVKLTNTENGKSVVVRINDRMKTTDNNKVANISKSTIEELGIKAGKMRVKVQEIQGDDEVEHFWATADASAKASTNISPAFKKTLKEKEVEVETTKMEGFDVNHVYDLNGKMQEMEGFGLQLAAFGQLQTAKDFAIKLAKQGETEKVFIQVSKSADKPMVYRVIYGFFSDAIHAKDSQKKMETLGHTALVKGF